MLTPSDIAAMRQTAEAALPDQMTRQTRTITLSDEGCPVETWTPAGTCACRLRHGAPLEAQRLERHSAHDAATATLLFPTSFELTAQDRVVVGDETYRVRFVREPSEWQILGMARVERVAEAP